MPHRNFLSRRGVAQPGRAPGSGPGGRRFKSSLPDQLIPHNRSSSKRGPLRRFCVGGKCIRRRGEMQFRSPAGFAPKSLLRRQKNVDICPISHVESAPFHAVVRVRKPRKEAPSRARQSRSLSSILRFGLPCKDFLFENGFGWMRRRLEVHAWVETKLIQHGFPFTLEIARREDTSCETRSPPTVFWCLAHELSFRETSSNLSTHPPAALRIAADRKRRFRPRALCARHASRFPGGAL